MEHSHQGLLVIKASAGSGKTYTLAKRYIELLLFAPGDDGLLRFRRHGGYHSHILAITFTNKATDEMKRRIVDELYVLSSVPENSDFLRDFRFQADRFAPGMLETSSIQKAARQALADVLYGYGTFNVSTIDSFFQSILRNFARELDRDYNYEVQIDQDLAMRTAIHNFLLSLGADSRRASGGKPYRMNDIERWVQAYIRQQVDAGKDWNFFKDDGGLFDFASLMGKETFRSQMPELNKYLTREVDGRRVSDLNRINAFKKRVIELAQAYGERYRAFAGKMRQLVDKHDVDENRLWKGRLVAKLLRPDNMFAAGTHPKTLVDLDEEKLVTSNFTQKYAPSQDFVDEVMNWRNEALFVWNAWQMLLKLPPRLGLLALLNRIDENLKAYSRETNQLLISDTNDLIGRVLESGVPFLYERVGTWINHYMIDEFQDTSHRQYENFKPLLYEALSQQGENLCMLIGDAKQSIYRFRNAAPGIFRDDISRDFTPSRHGLHQQTLDTNFRSCPAVVEFNNWLFCKLLQNERFQSCPVLQKTYMPDGDKTELVQLTHKTSPQGMVRVTMLSCSKDDELSPEDRVLEMLPDYLRRLHRRFAWGRIGILVDRRNEGAKVVTQVMEYNRQVSPEQQIPIASDESMLIANSPSVRRIVSLLRFIDLTQYHAPEDADDEPAGGDGRMRYADRLREQHLYHVLGLFMQRMMADDSKPAGQVLAQCFRDTDNYRAMEQQEQMEVFAAEVKRLLPERRTELMTIPNIVEHIIALYIKDAQSTPLETAHLLAFQDCVSDFTAHRGGGTVREFLNYWDKESGAKAGKLTVPASASDDSINVMTIHKSKGLEFDCVVIPFANWKLAGESKPSGTYWMSREQFLSQDGMRVFDVAGGIDAELLPPILPLPQTELKALAKQGLLQQYVDKYEQDVMVDNMDKTYVAFTRSREELHILSSTGSDLGKTMQDVLERGLDDADAYWVKDGDMTYEWGKPRETKRVESVEGGGASMLAMPAYYMATGKSKLSVRLPEDLTDKQNTGTRLHNLMSRIAYRRDVERAWRFCLNRGIIQSDDLEWPLERVRGIIDNMFDDSRTRDWFADENRVYNERNLSPGRIADRLTKRPDRVILRPDGRWIVIDYKFGEKDKRNHVSQVRGYMRRLKRMGKTPISGYLWYVGLDEVVSVELETREP